MSSVSKSDFLKVIIVSPSACNNYCKLQMIHVCYCLFFQDATGGRGADVIVEMLANASLSKDIKLVANKGRIGVMDHFRFHGIGLGLACNGGSFGEYCEMKFICIPAVQINFISHLIPVTDKDELDKLVCS